MATSERQQLIWKLEKKLSRLDFEQLKTVACEIGKLEEKWMKETATMNGPDVFKLIIDFVGSEKLKDSEDEGLSHLLFLTDVTENLLKGTYTTDPDQEDRDVDPQSAACFQGSRGSTSSDVSAQGGTDQLLQPVDSSVVTQAKTTSSTFDHITSKICINVGPPTIHQMTPKTEIAGSLKLLTISGKYDHITSKVLIQSGSPTVYQLTPEKEMIGTLKKLIFGKKIPNKENKTILLVGETGTGKSSLLNALVNYAMGVQWEDNIWFEIVEDEKRSQTESQTSDVIVYQIFGFEGTALPYSLTIVDTPGYGGTRGIEQDEIIKQRLFDWFRCENGVHEINAVGLVLKASENRVSERLRYVFDSVVSLFGKDVKNKIVALITHSDGRKPKNALRALEAAKVKCATDEKNGRVYFLFDNCQEDDRTEDTEELKHSYYLSLNGTNQFSDFLKQSAPQKMKTTLEVLREQIRLAACIQNLQERISVIELHQDEINQSQEALKKYEEEMTNNKNFTVEVKETYKEKENITGKLWGLLFYKGATCCTVCEENCHHPGCTISWYPKDCEVMKRGHCTSCTKKCPVSAHVKENWIYVSKTRKVQKTLQDMKKKYEQNKTGCESQLSLLQNLSKKMEELSGHKDKCLEECYQHVLNLEKIALNACSLSTVVYLDLLIEKMIDKGDTEKVKKLEEMNSRVDEGIRAAMWYKLTAAGKEAKMK